MAQPLNAAVLVVDDNADLALVMVKMLKLKKISAHCVSRGHAALDWLAHSRPGLVILDLNMPDISGIEVPQRMKADQKLADIPVVLHSALDEALVKSLADTCGANGVLLKGRYTLVDVVKVVESLGIKPDPAAD